MVEFTPKEMRDYLVKRGYLIHPHTVNIVFTEAHNRVVESELDINVVIPAEIPFENFIVNKDYTELRKWSLTEVFMREFKNRLLNL
jgi:hypothetical protein